MSSSHHQARTLPSHLFVMAFAVALVLAVSCTLGLAAVDGPVIHTDDGPIQGTTNGTVMVYHGIPIAAPPVGSLRWKAPRRPAPWKDVIKRTDRELDPICPQGDIVKGTAQGQEDCLYASVFVPAQCVTVPAAGRAA